MPLPLSAPERVRADLADLKADFPGAFAAVAERIHHLREDPGDPRTRGRVWRTVNGETVRVPIVQAPDRSEWALAWTIRREGDSDVLVIVGIKRVD